MNKRQLVLLAFGAAAAITAWQPRATFAQQTDCLPVKCYEQALEKLQAARQALTQTRNDLEDKMARLGGVPIGAIIAWPGEIDPLPTGWMHCDGRKLVKESYPDLARVLAANWGEDSDTTITLPDLRGIFLRGVDRDKNGNSTDRDKDRVARRANKVGTLQSDATSLPSDTDKKFVTDSAPEHQHLIPTFTGVGVGAPDAIGSFEVPDGLWGKYDYATSAPTELAGKHSHVVVSGGDEETRPVNVAIFWIIRVE